MIRLPASASSLARNSSAPNCCGDPTWELNTIEIIWGEAAPGRGNNDADAAMIEPAIQNRRVCPRMSHRCLATIADVPNKYGKGLNAQDVVLERDLPPPRKSNLLRTRFRREAADRVRQMAGARCGFRRPPRPSRYVIHAFLHG